MARKPEIAESWFEDVVSSMVEENLSLRKAAQLHGIALTELEAQNVSRRQAFRASKLNAFYRHFQSLGSDPRRNKEVLLGKMTYCVDKLIEEGAYKDALAGGLQVAKVEYGLEGEVSGALGNLTAAEIAEVKKRLEALAIENTNQPVEVPKGPIN